MLITVLLVVIVLVSCSPVAIPIQIKTTVPISTFVPVLPTPFVETAGRIAFISCLDTSFGSGEIYVMNADGSAQTNFTNNQAANASPVWSR